LNSAWTLGRTTALAHIFLGVLLLFAVFPAAAQVGVYGEFSSSRINLANQPEEYGITFGGYRERNFAHLKALEFGPDLRMTLQTGSNSSNSLGGAPAQTLLMIQGGPRVAFRTPIARLQPYLEGLVGGGNSQIGETVPDGSPVPPDTPLNNKNGGASFELQGLGGLDLRVHRKLDWRVVEVGYARLFSTGNSGLTFATFSTGLVYHLR
jgi:hypothetical protein